MGSWRESSTPRFEIACRQTESEARAAEGGRRQPQGQDGESWARRRVNEGGGAFEESTGGYGGEH